MPTELSDDINERTFGAQNIDRVLIKFYNCVFLAQQPTPYSESEASIKGRNSYSATEHKQFSTAEREAKYPNFDYATS